MGEPAPDVPRESTAAPGAERKLSAASTELPAEGVVFDVDIYIEALDDQAPLEPPSAFLSRNATEEASSAVNVSASLNLGATKTRSISNESYSVLSTAEIGVRGLDSWRRSTDSDLEELSAISATQDSQTITRPPVAGVQRTLSLDLQGQCRLRGIRADHVLAFPGRMFWTNASSSKSDAFRLSKDVDVISYFLSHSWQASARAKYCALCLHFRWKPGFAIGLLASVVSVLLFPLELAPRLQIYIFVALVSGLLALSVTMFCWPVRKNVFLDKACIEQGSSSGKRDGIMSLGHFLSKSTNVLVLWDETFFTRLWCVFEYAVSLMLTEDHVKATVTSMARTEGDKPGSAARTNPPKSETGGVSIVVQPLAHCVMMTVVLLGNALFIVLNRGYGLFTGKVQATSGESSPMQTLIQTLMISLCIVVVSISSDTYIQRHVQASRNLFHQLRTYKTQDAECSCCTLGHTDPVTLEHIPCDRALIESTVQQWFGGISTFDRYVQETLQGHMSTQVYLPYRFVVFSCMPFLFDGIAGLVWCVKSDRRLLLSGLAYFGQKVWVAMVTVPLVWFIIFMLAQRMRKSGRFVRGVAGGLAVIPHIAAARFAFAFLQAWAYVGLVPVFGGITFACYRGCW